MLSFCILEITNLTNDRHHISNELLSFGVNISVYASIGLFNTRIELIALQEKLISLKVDIAIDSAISPFDTSIEFLYRLLQDSHFTF